MFRVLNLAPAARRYLESTGQQDGQDSLAGVNKTDTVPRASGSGVRAFAFGLLVIVAHFLSAEVRLGHKGNTVVLYASSSTTSVSQPSATRAPTPGRGEVHVSSSNSLRSQSKFAKPQTETMICEKPAGTVTWYRIDLELI